MAFHNGTNGVFIFYKVDTASGLQLNSMSPYTHVATAGKGVDTERMGYRVGKTVIGRLSATAHPAGIS